MHSLEMFVITWLIDHHSILNQTHTGFQHASVSLETPAVVRVSSLRTDDLKQKSTLPFCPGSQSCYPQAGAYFGVMCPTTNHAAWGVPPTELTTPSSPLGAASPHPFHSTHTDLSYALPLYSLWFPSSLNSYFGIVIKFDLKRHLCHVKTYSPATHLSIYLSILKKKNLIMNECHVE